MASHSHIHMHQVNLVLLVTILCMSCPAFTANPDEDLSGGGLQDWTNHGGDIRNRRYADTERKISTSTVSKLRLKWEFYAGKDISATPAIYNGILYFPSWNGIIYAIKAFDGSLIWKKSVVELTGFKGPGFVLGTNTSISRSTPTVAGSLLIIGIYSPCVVLALDRWTGNLIWLSELDKHPAALITMSGTYYNGGFYVGTSSLEEIVATISNCCIFIGSFVKLDIQSGKIIWQTYMLPYNQGQVGGYAGAAIWGSSPSIDIRREHVYIATGNLYSTPQSVEECQERENNQTIPPTHPDECIGPDVHSESILALDLSSGMIKWSSQLGGYDVWFLACTNPSTPNCPPGPNTDADFGEAPMMLSVYANSRTRDMVVAVQKSGFAWALDRDNGTIIWSTEAGPGGKGGGGSWGAATDEKIVYTNIANSDGKNFTLKPSNTTTKGGGWVAMDATNGKTLWSTPDPTNAVDHGPVSLANGVLFAGSTYQNGPIYGINALTGKIIWSYNTSATVYGGISVSNGCIYVGNGYKVSLGLDNPSFTPGTTLYAFCVY